jgi:hypothetical protein
MISIVLPECQQPYNMKRTVDRILAMRGKQQVDIFLALDKRNATALAMANCLPVFVIDKCPQAPIGETTTLCPDSAELQPGWLDALLKQQKQGVVDLRFFGLGILLLAFPGVSVIRIFAIGVSLTSLLRKDRI